MAENSSSVRLARFGLARALEASDVGSDKALEQMWLALKDAGTDPSNSTIYEALWEMYWAREDPYGALEVSLSAVTDDPVKSIDKAQRALDLLDQLPEIAEDLPEEKLVGLEESVESFPEARKALLLAGRLRFERGEFDDATRLLGQAPVDGSFAALMRIAEIKLALGRADEALEILRTLEGQGGGFLGISILGGRGAEDQTRFQLLLSRALAETGEYEGALENLKALEGLPKDQEPKRSFIRALAHLSEGRALEALEACGDSPALDLALLRAVIHLESNNFEAARVEALSASHQNPISPDVLLVRAQIELESAENLSEGRGLLEQARERTGQCLSDSRWPSLQRPFAQDRATFQYFLAEAADISEDERALELAESVDQERTKLEQNGRLNLIRGRWLIDRDEIALAVKAFVQAANNLETAGMIPTALESAQKAFDLTSSGESATCLTRILWSSSFQGTSAEASLEYLKQARAILDEEVLPDESPQDTDLLVYYEGLVNGRKAELAERDRVSMKWDSAVNLMAVVLNSHHDGYRARFLSDELTGLDAEGAAVVFADLALEWSPDDFSRETAVVARANYFSSVEHVDELLQGGFTDHDRYDVWSDAVRHIVQVDTGEYEKAVRADGEEIHDAIWSRFSSAKEVYLREGIESATPLFKKVAQEASQSPNSTDSAVEPWLFANEPQKARQSLEADMERRNVPARTARYLRALVDLASGESQDAAEVLKSVERFPPFAVRQTLYLTVPILREVYADEAVGRGMDQLEERLKKMAESPDERPTILDGLDVAPDEQRELLQAMAKAIDAAEGNGDIAEAIQRLRTFEPEGRLGRVLELACERLEGGDDDSAPGFRPATSVH